MKEITRTQLGDLSNQDLLNLLPCTVLASLDHDELQPIAVMGKPDEIILLSDLHPRVRIQLKNLELKARAGMS